MMTSKMKLMIEIELDNSAFGDTAFDQRWEVGRILNEYFANRGGKIDSDKFEYGTGKLMDVNGNSVGKWMVL